MRRLEQITHPAIRTHLHQQIELLEQNDCVAAVVDAPVMFKSEWVNFCDVIIFVDVPLDVREARCIERGWTIDQLHQREAMQIPLEEKRKRSDFIIDNSDTPEKTFQQLQSIWARIITPSNPTIQPN